MQVLGEADVLIEDRVFNSAQDLGEVDQLISELDEDRTWMAA